MKKLFVMVAAVVAMATFTACDDGDEPKKNRNDSNDGFVTIDEAWDDGWTEHTETETIITEKVITENKITWDNVPMQTW